MLTPCTNCTLRLNMAIILIERFFYFIDRKMKRSEERRYFYVKCSNAEDIAFFRVAFQIGMISFQSQTLFFAQKYQIQ